MGRMTIEEAKKLLERIIDEPGDLTPKAIEAIEMGVKALEIEERLDAFIDA